MPYHQEIANSKPQLYRYAFQGQERDDEVKGAGNSYNYKYRMHDSRLGRFFAVDPLVSEYPWNSPYSFSGNRVINSIEREGLEEKVKIHVQYWKKIGGEQSGISQLASKEVEYSWSEYSSKILKVKNPSVVGDKGLGVLHIDRKFDGSGDLTNHKEKFIARDVNAEFKKAYDAMASVTKREKDWNDSESKGPTDKIIRSVIGDEWTDDFYSWSDGLEGSSDPTNAGMSYERGKKVMLGTVSVILIPLTAGSSLSWFGGVSLTVGSANTLDDLFSNDEGKSGLQQLFPNYEDEIAAGKMIGSALTIYQGSYKIVELYRDAAKTGEIVLNVVASGKDATTLVNEYVDKKSSSNEE